MQTQVYHGHVIQSLALAHAHSLPSYVAKLVDHPPTAGMGLHAWLFRAARLLHAYLPAAAIIEILTQRVAGCGRHVPHDEIVNAVRNSIAAQAPGRQTEHASALKWPEANPTPEQTPLLQQTLAQLVGLYRGLAQSIAQIDREVAHWLARTPGAWLTSIPGFGITLAAGWTAELGPPSQWHSVRQLCSYSGVVPKSKQTGGPQKEPVVGGGTAAL